MEQIYPEFKARVAAKLNLSLAVTGKRGRLHTLDMIVCPYEKLWDEAVFLPQNSRCSHKMPHIDLKTESAYDGFVPELFENFFLKKLDVIAREFNVSGKLILKKNIPLGAGLGGSSSATVAAIKSVEKCLENAGISRVLSQNTLLSLGSDVPSMYAGGFLRVRGTGEHLTPIAPCELPDIDVAIPPFASDSAACYAKYDCLLAEGKICEDPAVPTTAKEALSLLRNDLTLPATLLYPDLAAFCSSLLLKYPRVLMSGSGSAFICFKS